MGGSTRRYCLSPKACQGILRRAKERGKILPKALEETLEKMASVPNGEYKVTSDLDKREVGDYPCGEKDTFIVSQETFLNVDEGVSPHLKARDYKAPHAVCYEESVVAIEGNGMRPSHNGACISDEGVSYTLTATEIHGVGYKEPTIYDMKQHHAPSESDTVQLTTGNCKGVRGDTPLVMDVVSWKERDRLAQPRVNITDPVAAADYKGPSFVGYMEKDNEALCVQMANTSSNGSNINHDISATLAKNNTLAVAYKDEHES